MCDGGESKRHASRYLKISGRASNGDERENGEREREWARGFLEEEPQVYALRSRNVAEAKIKIQKEFRFLFWHRRKRAANCSTTETRHKRQKLKVKLSLTTNVGIEQLGPIRADEVKNSVRSAFQSHSANQKRNQHDVREKSRKISHFSRRRYLLNREK